MLRQRRPVSPWDSSALPCPGLCFRLCHYHTQVPGGFWGCSSGLHACVAPASPKLKCVSTQMLEEDREEKANCWVTLCQRFPSLSLIYLPGLWGFFTAEPSGQCVSGRTVAYPRVHRQLLLSDPLRTQDTSWPMAPSHCAAGVTRFTSLLSSPGARFSVAVVRAPAC